VAKEEQKKAEGAKEDAVKKDDEVKSDSKKEDKSEETKEGEDGHSPAVKDDTKKDSLSNGVKDEKKLKLETENPEIKNEKIEKKKKSKYHGLKPSEMQYMIKFKNQSYRKVRWINESAFFDEYSFQC
jgi:hypothetical protein